jgi:Flp pilus assembly protein TadD
LLPDSSSGILQLALAEQGLGQLDSAYAHFSQLIQRRPDVEAYYRRAMVAQPQGHLPAARKDIDQALLLAGPGAASARLHRVKGELAAMAGDSLLARMELDSAVALAPNDPVNYNSRGYYGHAFRGDHAGAILEYDKAIKLNPNYSYAFNNRGWSYYMTGRTDKALKDIQHARKKKPRNPFIYRNLGMIALGSGDTVQACIFFRQALDRGFTELYGPEVKEQMAAHCGSLPPEKTKAPVQAPQGTLDRKTDQPVRRVNAP